MGRRFHSNRNDSGSLLASVFIISLGAGCSLFTVAAMSPTSLPAAMWTVGGVSAAFFTFVILQRFGKLPSGNLSFLLKSERNRRDDGARDYEPRLMNSGHTTSTGTNQPISAQEAHEIKVTSANTWVPAATRDRRKK
jgi:hypothetical protein